MTALLVLTWLLPLILAPLAVGRGGRWAVPLAVAPALLASALIAPGTSVDIPWLLLGARFGLDAMGRVFLGFTSVLWLLAGLSISIAAPADRRAGRLRLFFLLAMSGNLGLVVAQDLAGFYAGFALMGLAAYGLVIHDGTASARRAGRIYLVFALVAEVALFAGFVLLYQRTDTLTPAATELAGAGSVELSLLVVAFGIKVGLLGLHSWLPLAYSAAPAAASAVLSGAMSKAGLLGLLRYLPLGHDAMELLGGGLMIAGGTAAFAAVPAGLLQRDPKALLAYSSIAKMGTLLFGVGVAATWPPLAPAMIAALVIYAVHHGLVKGALFLGAGVVEQIPRRWPVVVLAIPALVLAGAPLTSGAVAKAGLVHAAAGAVPLLTWGLTLASAGTALMMIRFLILVSPRSGAATDRQPALALPWLGLVAASLALSLIGELAFSATDLWPLLAAALLAPLGRAVFRARVGRVPPGDILEPASRASARLWQATARWARQARRARSAGTDWKEVLAARTRQLESSLGFGVVGLLWLALIAILLALMASP